LIAVIPAKAGIQKRKVKVAGGCPAASYFLLLRQKKVTKEKARRSEERGPAKRGATAEARQETAN
jgi:hypothetical protein